MPKRQTAAQLRKQLEKSTLTAKKRNMAFALAGGYNGARTDKVTLSNWLPGAGSPDVDMIRDLPTLRSRSADAMRNQAVAVGALNIDVSQTIGTGLSFAPSIDYEFLGLSEDEGTAWNDATARRFNAWAGGTACDLADGINFYQIQELAYRSYRERGDTFVLTPVMQGVLKLQLVEGDRACNPNRISNTDTLIEGMEIDPVTRRVDSVWFARYHPGDYRQANVWEKRPVRGSKTGRRNVLHLFKPLRPGQIRGVPWIAPILENLKQLTRWSDAELNAAVTSSIFSVFLTMDSQAYQDLFDEDAQEQIVDRASRWSGEMESGKAVNLLPGESVESPTPGRPNPQFDPFFQACVQQIGMALGLPFEVLMMRFQSSYSASRASLLMAWKMFRAGRDLMVTQICAPVYELWLENEILEGRIDAPGFFDDPVVRAAWLAGMWTGDAPGSMEPLKEVNAAKERIALGISTMDAESILHDGIPWQVKVRQRKREIAQAREAGMLQEVAPNGQPIAPQGAQQTPPEDDAEDDAEEDEEQAQRQADRESARQLTASVAAMAGAVATLAAKEPVQISVPVHNHLPAAAAPAIHFEAIMPESPPANVTVEAIMPEHPAPVVNFEAVMPQAQIIHSHPSKAIQEVELGADGELVRSVTNYEYS